ncbi:hypothetical protein Syun_012558 [Stephania yunnanensis]|uniref:FAR1 domain-containing protein n=1 Tax=Stephania yunnanensis TaxID=152371 RepID=A0AAP0JZM0_9MAGN
MEYKASGEKKKLTGSKKCGCQFKISIKHKFDGLWQVWVVCGLHNHSFTNSLLGHSYAGRLSMDEKEIVRDMSKTSARPRDILSNLKSKNKGNVTVMKTIYNERFMLRKIEANGKSKL